MTTPALNREIGRAERTMRALLERRLEEAGLSFPEWTVLTFLRGAGPLAAGELVRRQVGGRVASEAEARSTVDGLLAKGLLVPTEDARGGDPGLVTTAAGETVYEPVRRSVGRITDELYGDLPEADLEATRRTLVEVARRASAKLTGG